MQTSRPAHSQVRIAADLYQVDVKEEIVLPDGEAVLGHCDMDTRLIELEARPEPLDQLCLAWHEVLHAIDHQYGLRLSERQVRSLGHAIAATLYDNIPFWMGMGLTQHPDCVKD